MPQHSVMAESVSCSVLSPVRRPWIRPYMPHSQAQAGKRPCGGFPEASRVFLSGRFVCLFHGGVIYNCPFTARMKMSFIEGMISRNERISTASLAAAITVRTAPSSGTWRRSVR